MSWEGPTEVFKAALADIDADWRWTDDARVFRIGPDLPDVEPGTVVDLAGAPLPIVPLGKTRVRVEDHAEYYLRGEPRPLAPLLLLYERAHPELTATVETTRAQPSALVVSGRTRDLRCGHDWRCADAEELWSAVQARWQDAVDNVDGLEDDDRWSAHETARGTYVEHVASCEKAGE